MRSPNLSLAGWRGDLLAVIAGALVPLSMAPWDLWPLGALAAGILALCIRQPGIRRAWWRSYFFGLGMYGAGVSWVYISIHDFGYTAAWLAAIMTAIFVAFIALLFALPFYLYIRFFRRGELGLVLGFPAIWVLGEWTRSWFLTGFPWLYLGYGHLDTWLAGWAPIAGVYGLSFLAVLTGVSVVSFQQLLEKRVEDLASGRVSRRCIGCALGASLVLWLAGWGLKSVEWTQFDDSDRIKVSIVQPNIPLAIKWNPLYRGQIIRTLKDLTEDHWDSDLVIWPEASIPLMYHDATDFIAEMSDKAKATNTSLVSGILFDDQQPDTFYNSIIGMGLAQNIYFKERLVPFGEYVPLEKYLRGIIAFFDLPNSVISVGPDNQLGLQTPEYSIAPYICYEVVYPDLVVKNLGRAQLLITISNDAWFGKSIGPLQHFQMARMRALETGRYMIRGTNTGISAIIDQHGQVVEAGSQFVSETLSGDAFRTHGFTPFATTGSWPLVLLCALMLVAVRKFRRQPH